MHRRGFLQWGGAAAVAGAASGVEANFKAPGEEIRQPAPAGARLLRLALAPGYELAGFAADRLAHRIALATGGRFRIERGEPGAPCDLSFGDVNGLTALHPGFAFFAGLPAGTGLPSAELNAWLVLGGGQLLWDDLARPFGLKTLVAGLSECGGLWSNVRLEQPSDLAGLPVAAEGLAARVLERLGARPSQVAPNDLGAALARGEVAAAQWAGPLPAVAFDLAPLAPCLYQPGLCEGGTLTALTLAGGLWDELASADQVVFEACAAQEYRLQGAEAKLHAGLTAGVRPQPKWPVHRGLPTALSEAMTAAARAVVADLAAHDATCRAIVASYEAYRSWRGIGV